MGEFTAYAGFGHSETNNLINNLKKPMDRKGKPEWAYKERAIKAIATDLRNILGRNAIEGMTFVPMPPSKVKGHPEYDDRILRILQQMGTAYKCDLRELLLQKESTAASHTCKENERLKPREIFENLIIDENLINPTPSTIAIFDDVVTAGAHYVAAKRKLLERFPDAKIYGLFAARRIKPNNPLDDFENLTKQSN
jgi:predicted amidophosphoribosyltransferase